MSSNLNEPVGKSSWRYYFTPQFVSGIIMMSTGVGFIVGFAISRNDISLLAAGMLAVMGFMQLLHDERGRARNR